ncbi:MAG: hypothetical protein F4X68_15185 [Acidimicrobiia bacterium]|nr:hypothetical protein [Acidimicrobiia bacterium]MXW58604.1 hypothetical protein [Acidimicrobiia bacterium]MXZ87211.1 hypothetical protein [Acidimicrobiia bacterium]MYB75293.1 hypothetical protein [Acidimicrobiia bacterium]MYE74695.1 hypothetical protein [Acidimicrobiia bacterium]
MTYDPERPAGSVFRIDPVRIPRLKNAFRVIGSLIVGFVTLGFGPAPSSQQLVVRLVATGETLGEFQWSDGRALFQDLGSLNAGQFAEQWLSQEEAVLEKAELRPSPEGRAASP